MARRRAKSYSDIIEQSHRIYDALRSRGEYLPDSARANRVKSIASQYKANIRQTEQWQRDDADFQRKDAEARSARNLARARNAQGFRIGSQQRAYYTAVAAEEANQKRLNRKYSARTYMGLAHG